MAALSNVHAASILNTSLRSGTYYLALFLTDPTASGTGRRQAEGATLERLSLSTRRASSPESNR